MPLLSHKSFNSNSTYICVSRIWLNVRSDESVLSRFGTQNCPKQALWDMEVLSSSFKGLSVSVARWYVRFWLEKVPCWISGLLLGKCDSCIRAGVCSCILCRMKNLKLKTFCHLFTPCMSFQIHFTFFCGKTHKYTIKGVQMTCVLESKSLLKQSGSKKIN